VASRDTATATTYAAEQGIPRSYGSYEDLLADPEIDVVYNPLPNSMHVPWSIRALEAGKHVLCEKPMARSVAAVEEAFDAAERAGRLLMEAFMWRFHEQTAVLERLVREQAVGPVRHVRTTFAFTLAADSGDVRWNHELEGGALMDVGCYCVSGLRTLLGEPLRVSAEAVKGGPASEAVTSAQREAGGVDGRMAGVLRFAGGVTGSFECAFDTVPRHSIEVVGVEGTLLSSDPWHGRAPSIVRIAADGSREPVPVAAVNPYAREVEDLSRAVREGTEPTLGRADAVAQARVIEALYRSADEGRAIDVG
jgi:predicted dehydrogenase